MKISQIYKMLYEAKKVETPEQREARLEKQRAKAAEKRDKARAEKAAEESRLRAIEIANKDKTVRQKIQNIIQKLQNLSQLSQLGDESEISDVSLDTIEYLISTQNKVINNTISALSEMNIEPATYTSGGNLNKDKSHNWDIHEIITDMLSYQGYKDNILSELNNFFTARNEKGLTTNDFPANQVFNIDELISSKTGISTNVIKKLASIKGSGSITRGMYEVALTICSKNGKLGAEGASKGDITINGNGVEVKAASGKVVTNGGKLAGQKEKANVTDVIKYANAILTQFAKDLNKLLKTNVAHTSAKGFVFFSNQDSTGKQSEYKTFDSYLIGLLQNAVSNMENEPDEQQQNAIVELFRSSYIKLMHSFIDTVAFDEIINTLTAGVSFGNIVQEGFLTNNMAPKFSRYVGALHMIHYHSVEPWDGIVIINIDTSNAVYIPAKIVMSSQNPISLASTLDDNIAFSIPDMRPGAARQVIAGVVCKA